jgi:uncharacterized SAM-binding protein YcdF (DUF218 family)
MQRLIRYFFLLLILCITADLLFFLLAPLNLLYPDTSAPPPRADAAAVLFSGFSEDFKTVNNESKRRLQHAIHLLTEGYVNKLVVCGGSRPERGRTGWALMREYLIKNGVRHDQILVEGSSHDSRSNLARLSALSEKIGLEKITVVSSSYHLTRIQADREIAGDHLLFSPYDPATTKPQISRMQILYSAHHNLAAFVASRMLPPHLYNQVVRWIRENTDF